MSIAGVDFHCRHTVLALELGDGKAEISAEWLLQLCAAIDGHPTLRRLSLRRMMINALAPEAAERGLQALSMVLRDSVNLEVLQLQHCGLESRHVLPLCSELRVSPIRLKELDLSGASRPNTPSRDSTFFSTPSLGFTLVPRACKL